MGKYVKYFSTLAEFSDYYNFGERPMGPDEGPETIVAYVRENEQVYYNNSSMDDVQIYVEFEYGNVASSDTSNTFYIKTGYYWADVYHVDNNDDIIEQFGKTWAPSNDEDARVFTFNENTSPFEIYYLFKVIWYKDDNGEKGEQIGVWYTNFFQEYDENTPIPTITYTAKFESDGVNPTRLGSQGIKDESVGVNVVELQDDIQSDVYVISKRAWYQFPSAGTYTVTFTKEMQNADDNINMDWTNYTQATDLRIDCTYQNGYKVSRTFLMSSSVSALTIGSGATEAYISQANNLKKIVLEDENALPAVGYLNLRQTTGDMYYANGDVENLNQWKNAVPSGWRKIDMSVPYLWWENGGEFASEGGNDILHVEFAYPPATVQDYQIEIHDISNAYFYQNNGPTAVTATTNDLVTGITIVVTGATNTALTQTGVVEVTAYDHDTNPVNYIDIVWMGESGDYENCAVATLKFTSTGNGDAPIVGNDCVMSEFAGQPEVYDPNGNLVSTDYSLFYVDNDNHTRINIGSAAGEWTVVLRRINGDNLLQEWLSGGEFTYLKYEEDVFSWGTHISLYYQAFKDCVNLETVELGDGFVGMDESSFNGCTALTTINCYEADSSFLDGLTLDTLSSQQGTVHIPSGAATNYWEDALAFEWTVVDDL